MPDATVIIPFHTSLSQLRRSLAAVRQSCAEMEIIVAADGATEDPSTAAAAVGARVIVVPGPAPAGPAVARNRAAAAARGNILVFVDTDVVVDPEALPTMCAVLDGEPSVAAVFGAYDRYPPEPNFMSQYRNLSHAYIHEIASPDASTFWAGLGAVRAGAFRAVGGFDERFRRPSVEDIDLGYRLAAAGHTIRLDPRIRGAHLKRWTVWSGTVTDVAARGVPWTQLMLRYATMRADLNTTASLRLSVALAWLLAVAVAMSPWQPQSAAGAALLLAALLVVNRRYYRWFVEQRGTWFAARVVFAHTLHHLCNGVSFVAGTVLHAAQRGGVRLPGALPLDPWPAPVPSRLSRS